MTQRGWHCVYDTHYHIVFPVKYRKGLLSDRVVAALKEIAQDIQERYELQIEKMGCDTDHIHLLVSIHPKYSIGQVVRLFKSVTARQLFARFPELKRDLWGGEFWTDGYYAATVGEKGNWAIVKKYVANQGKEQGKPDVNALRLW